MRVLLVSVQRNLDIIGLKGLHHFLLSRGHDSYLLYLPRFDPADRGALERLDAFVAEVTPQLIGVSLMANDYAAAVEATRFLKKTLPEVPVVWGGIHPTTAPEMCLEHADYVCVGEAEQALLDMAEAIEKASPLNGVRNLCYLEKARLVRNPLHPLVEDLDTLPIVAQVPPNSFVQLGHRVAPLTTRHLSRFKRYRGGVYKIMTSRGCPHGCAYCCNHFLRKLYGRWPVRRRSVAHVVSELEAAVTDGPPVEYVDFIDDCFLACDLDYLDEFRREYKARIAKPFIAKGTPRDFTRERMDLAVDAGMAWANVGLQSGSDRVCREVYNRQVSSEEFLAAARLIHEYPVASYYDVIVDNPFETEEDTLKTVETLAAAPRPCYVLVFSLNFYHGTDVRERALRECPEKLADPLTKDYLVRDRSAVNKLVDIASLLHPPLMRLLLARYRRAPNGLTTRMAVFAARLYALWVLAPITYFRLIVRTQKGSFYRALRVLPIYINGALVYYLNHLALYKRRPAKEDR